MAKSPDELLRQLETAGVLGGSSAVTGARQRQPAPRSGARAHLLYLILAAVGVAILGSVPIGQVALYPFSLFVTLVHEVCHAVAAVVTGGTVVNIRIARDLSGLTITARGWLPLIASAGYVGASLVGAIVIALPARMARVALVALALAPAAALGAFHPATLFTVVSCVVFLALLLLGAWLLPASWVFPVQVFLGLEIGLNAIRDLTTALLITGSDSHIRTDADLMSSALFLRPLIWVWLWAALSAVLLAAALWSVLRRAIYSP
jgi:hypothetical protein